MPIDFLEDGRFSTSFLDAVIVESLLAASGPEHR